MVAVSGGKDSYALLTLLELTRRRAPFDFSLVAVNLDQGHPGYPGERLENWLQGQGFDYRMLAEDTYRIVKEKIPEGKTYCSLCSRLRRGILYNVAVELGADRIALGHHRDDIIETALLNMFFAGQLKTMPPRLTSDDGRNTVIRPLAYCEEDWIRSYAEEQQYPIIPCNLCGSQENLQRQRIKNLLTQLDAENPKIKGNLFAALGNVRPTHLLDPLLRSSVGLDPVTAEPVEPRARVYSNLTPKDAPPRSP